MPSNAKAAREEDSTDRDAYEHHQARVNPSMAAERIVPKLSDQYA